MLSARAANNRLEGDGRRTPPRRCRALRERVLPREIGLVATIRLGKAWRGALGPRIDPARRRSVAAAGRAPGEDACGVKLRKDRVGSWNRGHPAKPPSVARRAQKAAWTVMIAAGRVRFAAAWRPAVIAVQRDRLRRYSSFWIETRLLGRCESKALKRQQPSKHARDYRAAQAQSPWCKLYHV